MPANSLQHPVGVDHHPVECRIGRHHLPLVGVNVVVRVPEHVLHVLHEVDRLQIGPAGADLQHVGHGKPQRCDNERSGPQLLPQPVHQIPPCLERQRLEPGTQLLQHGPRDPRARERRVPALLDQPVRHVNARKHPAAQLDVVVDHEHHLPAPGRCHQGGRQRPPLRGKPVELSQPGLRLLRPPRHELLVPGPLLHLLRSELRERRASLMQHVAVVGHDTPVPPLEHAHPQIALLAVPTPVVRHVPSTALF